MTKNSEHLRVAFVAGQLVQSGAEKQLVYMARALTQAGATARVYCLTRDDYYAATLHARGIPTIWIGRVGNPLVRSAVLGRALAAYRPHILQSANFFTNLYVSVPGIARRALTIGAIRNNTTLELATYGRWSSWLLHKPSILIANSHVAKRNAIQAGVRSERIYVLPNVIDLGAFDAQAAHGAGALLPAKQPAVVAVGRLVPEKRMDLFLQALALARREIADLQGVLIGDGPERPRIEALAGSLGLLPDGLCILGHSTQVPALLRQALMLVLCSDHEGFPNVVLEAMAAQIPVITTPAGDAATVVQHGVTGQVVPFNDAAGIAAQIVQLARSPELCQRLGAAGRERAAQVYNTTHLADRLLAIYRSAAEQQGHYQLLHMLPI